MRCFALVLLAASASAMMSGSDDMERIKRIMKSPVTQKIASELGLTLPEIPEYDFMANVQNIDINELAAKAGQSGCMPEGVAFAESTRDTVRDCVRNAYNTVTRSSRRRFGRSLINRIKERAIARATQLISECVTSGLNLVADGQLSQSGADAVIDAMTAPDEFKQHKKDEVKMCIEQTPAALSGADRVEFQMRCVGEMSCVDCTLGVADKVSPTVGFAAREGGGKCMMGLEPPPRAIMAHTACTAEEVSTLMRGRLEAAGRRRRRDADAMLMMKKLGGLEGLEQLLGVGPTPRPCRRTIFRRCPPTQAPKRLTEEKVDEFVAKAEAVVGPLDVVFAGVPERSNNIASCTYTALDTLNDDGSVNVDALRALMDTFEGADELKDLASKVVDYCVEQGQTGSVEAFQQCVSTASTYACRMYKLTSSMEMAG